MKPNGPRKLFFQAIGWRVVGQSWHGRARPPDSTWDVPEPELVPVINRDLEIVGYCAGNDMSSRSKENPLVLAAGEMYDASWRLVLLSPCGAGHDAEIFDRLKLRNNGLVFGGETQASQMEATDGKELVGYLAGGGLRFKRCLSDDRYREVRPRLVCNLLIPYRLWLGPAAALIR